MSRAREYARFAALADHFGLTPAEMGALTDRQIGRLYFHARDQHGGIAAPAEGPPCADPYREDMAALDGLLASRMIAPADHARLVSELKAKHGIG